MRLILTRKHTHTHMHVDTQVYSFETQTILSCLQDSGADSVASPVKRSDYSSPEGVAFIRANSQRAPRPRSNSDWSRMGTPHDLVPTAHGTAPHDPLRFAAVDPWDTRVCCAASLQVGARAKAERTAGLKSSMKAGAAVQDEELVDRALRLMNRSVGLIIAEHPLINVEIDGSGLLAMIDAVSWSGGSGGGDPLDPRQCVDIVGRLIAKLLPLIAKGELASRLPGAKRGRKKEDSMLLCREEIEILLGQPAEKHVSPKPAKGASDLQRLPPIDSNDHGLALAHSLMDQRPAVCLFECYLQMSQALSAFLSKISSNFRF